MIQHIVLFKLRPGRSFDEPEVQLAEQAACRLGDQLECLLDWRAGRNISERDIAYDFAVVGLVRDAAGLTEYLYHPIHQAAVEKWRAISTWVIADLTVPAASEERA